jgi:hypothetical protein
LRFILFVVFTVVVAAVTSVVTAVVIVVIVDDDDGASRFVTDGVVVIIKYGDVTDVAHPLLDATHQQLLLLLLLMLLLLLLLFCLLLVLLFCVLLVLICLWLLLLLPLLLLLLLPLLDCMPVSCSLIIAVVVFVRVSFMRFMNFFPRGFVVVIVLIDHGFSLRGILGGGHPVLFCFVLFCCCVVPP